MTNKRSFLIASLAMGLAFTACQQKQTERTEHTQTTTTAVHDSIAVVTYKLDNGGWGYKINKGSHTYIEQPFIPVIIGNKPFQSEADARKVGENIAAKLRNNPGGLPDLSRQELLEMKIAGVE
ncbi:DUF4907 domain-containing protein [Chitinophaga rhizophila]|uniref:DUF4907 domain-containing protein n=1 Tax=Chitinophaga rhizophila TaxID=2866212 RepID=A0ABS7GBB0_9BACT|nr:DUF4907 domain-containing protein [Chitinophaga rhizophila]MBW8684104.1 DUF4907 domain-containing protein [Chitinophaga rhizophila]